MKNYNKIFKSPILENRKNNSIKNFYDYLKDSKGVDLIADGILIASSYKEEILEAWNEFADHDYFNDLVKIHYKNAIINNNIVDFLRKGGDFLQGSISVNLAENGSIYIRNFKTMPYIGVLVEGKIYYASNDQNSVWSGNGQEGYVKKPFLLDPYSYSEEDPLGIMLDKKSHKISKIRINEGLIKGFAVWGLILEENTNGINEIDEMLEQCIEHSIPCYSTEEGYLVSVHPRDLQS